MKHKDLAQMSVQDREVKKKEFELELIKLNTQVATGTPPKNAGMVSRLKKDIARINLLNSKTSAEAKVHKTK
jgi:ribosomal protein L29